MRLPSRHRRFILPTIALAALATIAGDEAAAEDASLTAADGAVIELNRLSPSTRFVGALAIWVRNSYALSVDCSPPRACYAKSQVVNYHFSCGPRYIVVGERISMDLNGNIVKHEVQPAGTTRENYEVDSAALERFCGPLPDSSDLLQPRRERVPPEKPPKGQ